MSDQILVYADWTPLNEPKLLDYLYSDHQRDKELFSFEYSKKWLEEMNYGILDPDFCLFNGGQYLPEEKKLFDILLDSCPDRWGKNAFTKTREYLCERKWTKT